MPRPKFRTKKLAVDYFEGPSLEGNGPCVRLDHLPSEVEQDDLTLTELEGCSKYGMTKYSIHVESTEPDKVVNKHIKADWVFVHEGLWRERCKMLAGLCALRGVFLEKSDRDTETCIHYTMPYTSSELHTIFGSYEELT